MEFSWEVDPEVAFGQMVDEYVVAIKRAIRLILLRFEPEVLAWMKANAPWTDRSGNLRQTLQAFFHESVVSLSLIADYGQWYGVFLELSNAGRFAVIAPAIDVFAPRIFQALQEVLG